MTIFAGVDNDAEHQSQIGSDIDSLATADVEIRIGQTFDAGGRISFDASFYFSTITIPPQSIITSAKFTFEASTSESSTAVNCRIRAESADDASAPTTDANWHTRTFGDVFVDWDNIPATVADASFDSIDFSPVIQQLVDRTGWASGNAIHLVVSNNISGPDEFTEALRTIVALEGTGPIANLILNFIPGVTRTFSESVVVDGDLQGRHSQVQTNIRVDGRINATDFNEFRGQLNALYKIGTGDLGYDGPTVLPGFVSENVNEPTSTEYDTIIDVLQECKTHQDSGVTLPLVTRVESGDIIFSVDSEQIRDAVDTLETTRFDIADGQRSLITGTTAVRTASTWGGTPAPSTIDSIHRCAFTTDTDNFRFYFNLGGYFGVTPTVAAGGNPQAVEWAAIFAQCGIFTIHARSNVRSGAGGVQDSTNGVFDLTTSFVDMWTFTGTSPYTANTLTIAARVDVVSFGTLWVEIRCTLVDDHVGVGLDVIDRDITITPEARRSTGVLPVPQNETITREDDLA